jgi:hypothetical protein
MTNIILDMSRYFFLTAQPFFFFGYVFFCIRSEASFEEASLLIQKIPFLLAFRFKKAVAFLNRKDFFKSWGNSCLSFFFVLSYFLLKSRALNNKLLEFSCYQILLLIFEIFQIKIETGPKLKIYHN